MKVKTMPGVFAPISDSWLLVRAIRDETIGPGDDVLDVCTGSGILALAAARSGASVTAVDVSWRALVTTRMNALRNSVHIRTLHGRTFEPVGNRRYDLIVSNPPYVPSARASVPSHGASRAWEAGPDGRLVLDDLCDHAAAHLRPGGAVLLVQSSLIGEEATIDRLGASGLCDVAVIERRRGPLGPLMRAQQLQGRVPRDVHDEEVLVVRAVAPQNSE